MAVAAFRLLVVLSLAALSLSCQRPGRNESSSVAAAGSDNGDASEVPVEALASLETVYVPVLASSLLSLDGALAEKGQGNVTSSDFEPRFQHADMPFGPAVVAFSTSDWIESQTLFQPMSLTQWLDAALEDEVARGVVLNPGHAGQTLSLTKAEITQALAWLPKGEPLPIAIYVTR